MINSWWLDLSVSGCMLSNYKNTAIIACCYLLRGHVGLVVEGPDAYFGKCNR